MKMKEVFKIKTKFAKNSLGNQTFEFSDLSDISSKKLKIPQASVGRTLADKSGYLRC